MNSLKVHTGLCERHSMIFRGRMEMGDGVDDDLAMRDGGEGKHT